MPSLLETPPDLSALQAALADALLRVEQRFNDALASDLPPVDRLCRHIESYRGKMLRPALVLLSGAACSPAPDDIFSPSSPHLTLAAVCEMIHMATLVHDDVLDEADTRRKGLTINRLHGNEAAVILGDYLFSAAYRLCSTLDSQHAALLIGATGMTLCAGELLQLHHRENFSIDEETYFEIVRRKTASLIAVACRLGASTAGADDAAALALHDFGLKLGVAFQIQDDLLDLTGNESLVGKPLRRDVQLGKLTLPIIHHLAASSPQRRGESLLLLRSSPADATAPAALLAALKQTDSLRHTADTAASLVQQAKHSILSIPDSPSRRFLLLMADAVISRSF